MTYVLTDDQWKRLIMPLVAQKNEDVLSVLIGQSGLQWPSKDAMKKVVSDMSFHLTNLSDSSDSDSDKMSAWELKKHQEIIARTPWWNSLVDHYSLDIPALMDFHPHLIRWMMSEKMYAPLANAIARTAPEKINTWLALKTDTAISKNAHDKCSVLGSVVLSGAFPVLDALKPIHPQWVCQMDNKNRSPLFYARSKKMVEYLCKAGVDPLQQNKEGQTADAFWLEQINNGPSKFWVETLAANNATAQNTGMIVKLMSLSLNDFSTKERAEFDLALTNPHWSWTGRLFEVERSWSLREIWKYGELLCALSVTKLPQKTGSGNTNHYGYSIPTVLSEPNQLAIALKQIREQLPTDIQEKWFGSSRVNSMGERICEWMMMLSETPQTELLFSSTVSHSKFSQNHSQERSKNIRLATKNSEIFFNSLSATDKNLWATEMAPFWAASWMGNDMIVHKLMPLMELAVLPVSLGGMASEELAASWAQLRQTEGVRAEYRLMNTWANAFVSAFAQKWSEHSGDPEQNVQWAPVLRIGLVLHGSNNDFATAVKKNVATNLEAMLVSKVPMDKIPVRWTKTYPPSLLSAVQGWVIEKSLTQTQKSKKRMQEMEEAAPRRRRM